MKIRWCISQRDVNRVKKLVEEQTAGNHLIRCRKETNLSKNKPHVTPTAFWHKMVSARITTQTRSGPGSPADELANAKPFPLSLKKVRKVRSEGDVKGFIATTISNRKIGKYNQHAEYLATNLDLLENGEWKRALKECNRLTTLVSAGKEREVATYVDDTFKGFGPKQSRNLLQMLGLTRYEIPIDSRLTKWLNEFDFPVKLNATVLGDRGYYEFVSDGVQELCREADVFPCIFDAAAFASQAAHPTNKKEEEQ